MERAIRIVYFTQMTFCAIVMVSGIPTWIFGLPLTGCVMVVMGGVGFAGGKMDYDTRMEKERLKRRVEERA